MSSVHETEIWIVPFFGQGHLFPCMELCKQLSSRNYKTTLIISSNLSINIPSSLRHYPLVEIAEIPSSPPVLPQQRGSGSGGSGGFGSDPHQFHFVMHNQMVQGLESLLSTRLERHRRFCAIIDVMMAWTGDVFKKFEFTTVGFFTSGACSAAMEYAMWKAHPEDIKPGERRLLPGLPEEMALTEFDLKRRPHGPPGGRGPPFSLPPGMPGPRKMGPPQPGEQPPGLEGPPGGTEGGPRGLGPGPAFSLPPGMPGPKKMGPPQPGEQPPWVEEAEGSIALMINTCDDLELPFINYLENQMGKPVWGVGPLLPEQFYKSSGSLLHDNKIRTNNLRSNISEDEVISWLDSKQQASVLYVSFGSEVGPTVDEYHQLADALKASNQPFIWVIQAGAGRPGPPRQLLGSNGQETESEEEGYFPHGLDTEVGSRGLIIRGWAPQLLILSHPSTGGFLSHCGWNSTVEAIGRGVPFLAWPIRGDQYYNAKLVVDHLKVGYMISDDLSRMMKRDDIMNGIERLMGDEEMKKRAEMLSTRFDHGFPASSVASLDAFSDLINRNTNISPK